MTCCVPENMSPRHLVGGFACAPAADTPPSEAAAAGAAPGSRQLIPQRRHGAQAHPDPRILDPVVGPAPTSTAPRRATAPLRARSRLEKKSPRAGCAETPCTLSRHGKASFPPASRTRCSPAPRGRAHRPGTAGQFPEPPQAANTEQSRRETHLRGPVSAETRRETHLRGIASACLQLRLPLPHQAPALPRRSPPALSGRLQ
mmetsp:Transcript_57746/g.103754  ORF Transcript_57746/g.103754 Transcript_57746/m.103754 type:complete len:202 (+) Transcript_57746:158-763(+)